MSNTISLRPERCIKIGNMEEDYEPMLGKDKGLSPRLAKLYDTLFGSEARISITIFVFVLVLGLALGFALPPDGYREPYGYISSCVGWIYFSAWSVSFWPQIFLNWSRKSVEGLSFDFLSLNLLGFACYSAYNLGYAYNPGIRDAYRKAHNGR